MKRYKYLPVLLVLVCIIMAGCFLLPGFILRQQRNQDMGYVKRGENIYYADNVSVELTNATSFDRRVQLVNGQMQSQQEEMERTEGMVAGDTMDEIVMNLTQLVFNISYYGISDEEVTIYFTATDKQLYKYTDTVLNKYYCYVWEYQWQTTGGKMIHALIDAVTGDIYELTIGGDHRVWAEETLLDEIFDIVSMDITNSYEKYMNDQPSAAMLMLLAYNQLANAYQEEWNQTSVEVESMKNGEEKQTQESEATRLTGYGSAYDSFLMKYPEITVNEADKVELKWENTVVVFNFDMQSDSISFYYNVP